MTFLNIKTLHLEQITLINYKNISEANFTFDHKINCFVGRNGVGKTTLLDAIYHLAFGKSYFNPLSVQNIKHESDFFMIEGVFSKNDRQEQIVCSFKKGQKKILKRNGKIYEKFSEHIGQIPLVMISPADADLIAEGSEVRRKFMDGVISQWDKKYLNQLIDYHKIISQRNALLKFFALNHTFDGLTLQIYNEQIAPLAEQIFQKRKEFMVLFEPIFQKHYHTISEASEHIQLTYESHLFDQPILPLLESHLSRDRALQYTSVGVHKDDLHFKIDAYPIKKFGSQGQQKTYLIALKLAQFDFLTQEGGEKPILLLDDVFDKLDAHRVGQLVAMVNNNQFGQIFITDTHAERTEEVVKQTEQSYQMIVL